MTALDKLNNYRARWGSQLSARKITEPLARAMYWKQEMWSQQALYRWAAKPSVEADIADDEFVKARVEYRLIIRRAWAQRWSDRCSMGHLDRALEMETV